MDASQNTALLQQLRRAIRLNAGRNPDAGGGVQLSLGGSQALQALHLQGSRSTAQAGTAISNPVSLVGTKSHQLPAQPVYSYKVKIINPMKKSDVVVRQLHNVTTKFDSVSAIRVRFMEELKEHVPITADFDVGFFEGTTKLLMVSTEDVNSMYLKYKNGGPIMLWCTGRQPVLDRDEDRERRKRSRSTAETSRQDKEEEVDDTFEQLLERHGNEYDTPKLRLWSRMICSGIHDDFDTPPDIPAFSGAISKRPRKESLSDALSGAAVAFAKSLKDVNTSNTPRSPLRAIANSSTAQVSPSKAVELRMKNLEQLRYLQKLFDDGILNEEQHGKLKQDILSSLDKL